MKAILETPKPVRPRERAHSWFTRFGHPLTVQRVVRPSELPFRPKGEFWTDDELIRLTSLTDLRFELWDGEIVAMPSMGSQHGDITTRLLTAVANHVYEHKLGRVLEGQTGFRLGTDHCFAPDISFVSKERFKLIYVSEGRYFSAPPDLAVEVLSASDSITKTERKLQLYLAHGSRLAWMVHPKSKSVRVYRPDGSSEVLSGNQHLTGNSVLPGFRLSLHRLFEEI